MATYPRDRAAFLTWAQAHTDLWQGAEADIGLTQAQTAAFKASVSALLDKTNAQQVAKDAQKAATEAAVDADSATRELASDLVRSIRAFATNNNDPTVYQTAQIPAPQPGSPVPPPGQPTNFKIGLNSDGSITLNWKAQHPEGSNRVVYFVQRKLAGESNFSMIGGAGERSFTDDTLPFGVDSATYIVTAQRGNVSGAPSNQLTVSFGSVGGGGLSFTSSPSNAKLAA